MVATCVSQSSDAPNIRSSRRIELAKLGYQPPSEKELDKDPKLTFQDFRPRMVFVDSGKVALFFTRLSNVRDHADSFPAIMEVFYIDINSGELISHKTFPTRFGRGLNDSFDTVSRIIPTQEGFLLHSGNTLFLYSSGLQEKQERQLDASSTWAVRVAPLGRTFQLVRRNGDDAEVEVLNPHTLETISSTHTFPSIQSVSDDGSTVTKLAHCLRLQLNNATPRDLCCHDSCSDGLPIFMKPTEILSVYNTGFEVVSTHGEVLWARETKAIKPNQLIGDFKRTLIGNRFAITLLGLRNSTFDGIKNSKNRSAILVYDQDKRVQIFNQSMSFSEFALSPNGTTLAVLRGKTIYVSSLPD
jgi:hypothetical protein